MSLSISDQFAAAQKDAKRFRRLLERIKKVLDADLIKRSATAKVISLAIEKELGKKFKKK